MLNEHSMKLIAYIVRIILYISILLASAGWIWVSRIPPGETRNTNIPAPQVGFQAPDFTLHTLDGETIQLSQMRGKSRLINIWASWCTPCRVEMPALNRIYRKYQSEGFIVLGINATDQDDPSRAILFIEEQDLTFPILLDVKGDVSRKYKVRALPTTFFVDANGIIQDIVVGGPMSESLLHIRVQELLEKSK